jgi:UDP-N-acetylglucosamine 2-epimerase (hydrolysing)
VILNKAKKIIFLTSTRADFGKLKSLIKILKTRKEFKVYIIITGMHVMPKFGNTYTEITKFFRSKVIKFKNQSLGERLEIILIKTSEKFSKIVKKIEPDLIVIHGDRVEALACASVGSLNHILTAHVEGGEISGTIDDTIRHAVTKLSHIHFVGSAEARNRVIKMGEINKHIFNIGSPDVDAIVHKKLPTIENVKKRYSIKFKNYSILLWHPVTSKVKVLREDTNKLIMFINKLNENFVVIYPNNDPGSEIILNCYEKIKIKKYRILKNLRFENFLSLLKHAKYIIGNSSSAIYEAPILGTPSLNIGDRQFKRISSKVIKNLDINKLNALELYKFVESYKLIKKKFFGYGNSDKKFLKILLKPSFWKIPKQKFFSDPKKFIY